METTATPKQINDTKIQLNVLREIDDILGRASIPFWLRGGWAIEFLLGKITRTHSDIDLVVWKRHAPQVVQLFTQSGFNFERDLGIQMDFMKFEQEISVVYIAKNRAGQIFTADIPEWEWRCDALSFPPRQLNGLTCHVLSPEQLLNEKEGYQEGTGRPLRQKDLNSIAILRQLIG